MATINEIITPIEAVHPTELIIDEIEDRGISRKDMAIRLGMQPSNFSRMIKQKETITPQMANRLEEVPIGAFIVIRKSPALKDLQGDLEKSFNELDKNWYIYKCAADRYTQITSCRLGRILQQIVEKPE